MTQTPATVSLQRMGVAFTVHEFAHDPKERAFGLEAAQALGVDADQVFKTLITSVDGQLTVAVVPVSCTLDLKALAAAAGGKRAELADTALAERKTGYIVGGISPVGQKTALPTVIDETAQLFDTVFVSGGARGLDIGLNPHDLCRVTGGSFADIARS